MHSETLVQILGDIKKQNIETLVGKLGDFQRFDWNPN